MLSLEKHDLFLLLLWLSIITMKAEKWYSATVLEKPINLTLPDEKFGRDHLQDFSRRYTPLNNVDTRNKTSYMRNFKKPYNISTAQRRQVYIDINKSKLESEVFQTLETRIVNGSFVFKNSSLPQHATQTNPVFKYNNTLYNINIVNTPKRKVIRKRCIPMRPSTIRYKQRQKKPMINQKAKTRFLEIFEVVEFDHVPCTSTSGLEGICLPEQSCATSRGIAMGTCADGYGTCCVTQFSCDDQVDAPKFWFVNPGYPSPSSERLSCVVTINKVSQDVIQMRLDFMNFELLPPTGGLCKEDQFVVSGQNMNNFLPILCGINSGQHMYIEVGDVVGPITLSVQTVSPESRLFAIKVTQITPFHDELVAPRGCLQYFRGYQGYLESFNYRDKSDIAIARTSSYLNNLNYAMCIERVPDTCSITYTNIGTMQIVNYDTDGLPVIPPGQAGVEIFNCPTDYILLAAIRLCGDRLNDGSVLQDFELDAPVTDTSTGPIVVWFRSNGGYVGRGFKLQYQQNNC